MAPAKRKDEKMGNNAWKTGRIAAVFAVIGLTLCGGAMADGELIPVGAA